MIDPKLIAQLRAQTGGGIMDCRKALEEAGNDYELAIELMRKQGQKAAAKRVERETHEGIVHSYIHANGKTGVLVEVLCETDFVARNEAFQSFVHDIALHIAAMAPVYVSSSEVPEDLVAKEKEIYTEQVNMNQIGFKIAYWDKNVERPQAPHLAEIRFIGRILYYYEADPKTQALRLVLQEPYDEAMAFLEKQKKPDPTPSNSPLDK